MRKFVTLADDVLKSPFLSCFLGINSFKSYLPLDETLFEEDLKFMELLLFKHKDFVKIKKLKDEERRIETTYISVKKNE